MPPISSYPFHDIFSCTCNYHYLVLDPVPTYKQYYPVNRVAFSAESFQNAFPTEPTHAEQTQNVLPTQLRFVGLLPKIFRPSFLT